MKMSTLEITTYRVKLALKETGLSQAELARRIGVKQQSVQKWVHGLTSPSMANLDILAEVTGFPPYWFMLPPDGRDLAPVPSPELTKPENIELLQVFDAFPDEEKQKILSELKEKKQTMEELVARWVARKGTSA